MIMVLHIFAISVCKFLQRRWVRNFVSEMGKHFGELATLRGLVYFKLSPFEQRAFPNIISEGVPNVVRRIRSSIFRVAPPFLVGYLVYDYVEKLHAQSLRKNPADYENDE